MRLPDLARCKRIASSTDGHGRTARLPPVAEGLVDLDQGAQ
jgi:hypothetical protein